MGIYMYVIQSTFTGGFLAPSYEDGQPEWVVSLREAGVVYDLETCAQLIEDHVDHFHKAQVVDLMKLHRNVEL